MNICKIASPASGDDYFSTDLGIMLDNKDLFTAPSGIYRTKKPGRPAADDYRVIFHLGKIAVPKNIEVVRYVTRHDKGQSAN